MGPQPAAVVANVAEEERVTESEHVTSVPDPTPVVGKVQSEKPRCLRGLYLFAGPSRHSDLSSAFLDLQASPETAPNVPMDWHQVDILREEAQNDLLDTDVRRGLLDSISGGRYAVVVAAPPCSSWSRAVFSDRRGPPPVRSRQYPLGFPWLSGKLSRKAEESNTLTPSMLCRQSRNQWIQVIVA